MSRASNLAGFVTSISPVSNLNVGVVTASSFVGDGSGLTGVGPSQQAVTSVAGITTINLSLGSVIFFTHNTDTTVAFANTSTTQEVTFIRTKDDTETPRTITWPTSIKWPNYGDPPELQSNPGAGDAQTFKLVTRNGGVTWYGWQEQIYYGAGNFLLAWGANNQGQLGQNNIVNQSSPVQIPGTTWSFVNAGGASMQAIKTDGTLWAWGNGANGGLAQNNVSNYSSPRQIPGTTWSSVTSNGNSTTLAIKTDGTLWTWGSNNYGALGQSSLVYYSSPVQIPGNTWSSVEAINSHILAIKTDNTLWSWGYNAQGQLGQTDFIPRSSPVQIPGTTWSSIGSAAQTSLAIKTDGTLWAWGTNTYGQLGQNNTTQYDSPVQIPGTTWSSLSSGAEPQHSLARKTDGTLWAWGRNQAGELGQNNTTHYSSPVQIPGTTWSSVASGGAMTLARKTDGTLWTWGSNGGGRLGLNDIVNRSSPIQIPGVFWNSISSSSRSMATYIIT